MKRQRKLMQKALGVQHIPEYHPLLEDQTQPFLQQLLDNPSGLMDHVRRWSSFLCFLSLYYWYDSGRYAGGLILSVVYGYKIESEDKFLALAEECVDIILNDITAGGVAWPVDLIPALKYLPLWFPGAGFKRNAIKWKAKMEELTDKPYEFFKASMVSRFLSFCHSVMQFHSLSFRPTGPPYPPFVRHFLKTKRNIVPNLNPTPSGQPTLCISPVWTRRSRLYLTVCLLWWTIQSVWQERRKKLIV